MNAPTANSVGTTHHDEAIQGMDKVVLILFLVGLSLFGVICLYDAFTSFLR